MKTDDGLSVHPKAGMRAGSARERGNADDVGEHPRERSQAG
eukprot:CAMPEP_0206037254 /NCGR_PEP_ID=MMETSP1466-20131121/3329_1 /ASSEMBLY_ACC=CAM_ASM_001126 /TAXON_ID=44452 /ORGANISM="Pavlova gyrans, Strain CCMP608" /LENGTH=40 /DNA_ID= /DNA_START= /DNA_END= /DNA_ORIENTATION=